MKKTVKLRKKLHIVYVKIERSVGILKVPWRCLLERMDSEIENVSNIIINYYVPLELGENSVEHQSFLLFSFALLDASLRFAIFSLHCLVASGT